MPSSSSVIAAVNAAVTRVLIGSRRSEIIAESVAGAAERLQRRPAERAVDLVPQVGDVDADDVRVAVERVVPHVPEEPGPAQGLGRVAHEVLEQRELPRGELDRLIAAADFA